jgi:hypothetical protein
MIDGPTNARAARHLADRFGGAAVEIDNDDRIRHRLLRLGRQTPLLVIRAMGERLAGPAETRAFLRSPSAGDSRMVLEEGR